jgi:hypothetical protein
VVRVPLHGVIDFSRCSLLRSFCGVLKSCTPGLAAGPLATLVGGGCQRCTVILLASCAPF